MRVDVTHGKEGSVLRAFADCDSMETAKLLVQKLKQEGVRGTVVPGEQVLVSAAYKHLERVEDAADEINGEG